MRGRRKSWRGNTMTQRRRKRLRLRRTRIKRILRLISWTRRRGRTRTLHGRKVMMMPKRVNVVPVQHS
jgi:hypothetical protein